MYPYPLGYLVEQVPGLIVLLGAAPAEDRFVVHFHQLPFRTEAEVAKNSKYLGEAWERQAEKAPKSITNVQRPEGERTELQPRLNRFFQNEVFEGHQGQSLPFI